jgi:rhodanese-related sulfurtransferase
LLDVRTPVEHREVHIDGCRLEPLDALDAGVMARELSGRKAVIVCRSGTRAKQAAAMLEAAGVVDCAVLDGGMQAWQAAGLPVVRGQKAMSLERQVRVAAGAMVVAGVVLGTWVHPAWYGLSAFVGGGLVFAGLTDWCGMGLLLAKAPWNKVRTAPAAGSKPPTCCAG